MAIGSLDEPGCSGVGGGLVTVGKSVDAVSLGESDWGSGGVSGEAGEGLGDSLVGG